MYRNILIGSILTCSVLFCQQGRGQDSVRYRTMPTGEVKENDTYYNVLTGDSADVRLYPEYDEHGKLHRKLFGENYRKEYAALTRLPVLRISSLEGGLLPTKTGGGMQSKSVRLENKDGKEFVLRSVLKNPDLLLPTELRETFARDWVDDATSAQHPYGALIVPPIAKAAGVPHANPVIGIVAPDPALGIHGLTFANTVALFEERDPLGKSDNSLEMLEELIQDNDNSYDAAVFFKAKLLDLLIGDWDRHEDQWRWKDTKKGGDKFYVPVPRDRDQVLHKTEGLFPRIASRSYVLPTLQGFGAEIKSVKYSLFKTRFMDAFPASRFSHEQWSNMVKGFTEAVSDSVLQVAVRKLPEAAYKIRSGELLSDLKTRRDNIPEAMERYYHFIHKIVDVRLSDKHEKVTISSNADNSLNLLVRKINKEGLLKDTLMYQRFEPAVTKEIRLFLEAGNDSLEVKDLNSPVKLRVVGGTGIKNIYADNLTKAFRYYGLKEGNRFNGDVKGIKKFLDNDSANVSFVPVDLYNVWAPKTALAINIDDGLLLGAGFKYTNKEGFRKKPYTHRQELIVSHSFSTNAYSAKYNGEWIQAFKKADLAIQAVALAPDNTINFFGRGNETVYVKTGDHRRYYRTRFSMYYFDPSLQWRGKRGSTLKVGPSFQYYRFDADDNDGRFIKNVGALNSYDSAIIVEDKVHAGIAFQWTLDKRNRLLLPSGGYQIKLKMNAYEGLNRFSQSYAQIQPEIVVYKAIDKQSRLVLSNRTGGGVSVGKTAFYQSLFIGGHGNLLGYRQYRFAGQHSIYNNLELKLRLAYVSSYILPGEMGITGFHDIGRVWQQHEVSHKWHNGLGGGIYFSPARIAVLSLVMGHSSEGWYPYFSMGVRF